MVGHERQDWKFALAPTEIRNGEKWRDRISTCLRRCGSQKTLDSGLLILAHLWLPLFFSFGMTIYMEMRELDHEPHVGGRLGKRESQSNHLSSLNNGLSVPLPSNPLDDMRVLT